MDKRWFVFLPEKVQLHSFLLYRKSGKTPLPVQNHAHFHKHKQLQIHKRQAVPSGELQPMKTYPQLGKKVMFELKGKKKAVFSKYLDGLGLRLQHHISTFYYKHHCH